MLAAVGRIYQSANSGLPTVARAETDAPAAIRQTVSKRGWFSRLERLRRQTVEPVLIDTVVVGCTSKAADRRACLAEQSVKAPHCCA
jgi:hypothetical protein